MIQTIKSSELRVGDELLRDGCESQIVKEVQLGYPSDMFIAFKTFNGYRFINNVETLVRVYR